MFYYGTPAQSLTELPDGKAVSGVKLTSLAMAASIITLLGTLPQLSKVAASSDVSSFSPITLVANCIAAIMMCIFGYINGILANVLSGIAFFAMNLYFLYLSWR